MSTTYDYSTGHIKTDIHFVKIGDICRLTALPARIGNDWCQRCEHNKGTINHWLIGGDYSFKMCNHPKQQDTKDCGDARHWFYEKIKEGALSALCY